ncbi:hypothetical protein [Hymenobacter metallilatus]|uniref:Uncharacterized protein n=1 Tax=Hymenobacter metallilatus TaxID=2493666 RepID=A0A3R9NBK6_9BACT|nr:hypothetical protein [Hymenobacter metallilatus]RSK29844.1 hypothetical protein EI290_16035 [Hymenobacter metallilatus]
MRTLSLGNNHQLQYYQSILELPAARHLEYQCYAALQAGVGATEADAQRHEQLAAYFGSRPGKEQQQFLALSNAHYARHFAETHYSPTRLAFAVLVASVDGEPAMDITEDGLHALLSHLDTLGLTDAHTMEALKAARNAFREELAVHFPARFADDADELLRASHLKRRALALCDLILGSDQAALQTIEDMDNALLDMMEPDIFETGDPQNTLVLQRRAFGQLCAVLAQNGTPEPEKLTLFQFHSRVEHVTEQIKRENRK